MTAAEVYCSSDAEEVRTYYDALAAKGEAGERAMLILRAYRNVARIADYTAPKYIKFLRGRADHAVEDLRRYLLEKKQTMRRSGSFSVLVGAQPVKFRFPTGDFWKVQPRDREAVLKMCDEVMR